MRKNVCFFVLIAISMSLLTGSETVNAAQERVLVFGDSLMKLVSRSIEKRVDRKSGMDAVSIVSIGSGLARLDLFDWDAKIRKAVSEARPNAAVVMVGANDNQPMMTSSGTVQLGTDAWLKEYERRVSSIMDILGSGGVEQIIWIGLPDMRDQDLQKEVDKINRIAIRQAEGNAKAEYLDTSEIFSMKPGKYSPYILDKKTAMPVHVRAGDGVHLNRDGAEMLADIVMKKLD